MSAPIYISTESGEIINIAELMDRITLLEKRVPVFNIPKSRRKRKSARIKIIEKKLLSSYGK